MFLPLASTFFSVNVRSTLEFEGHMIARAVAGSRGKSGGFFLERVLLFVQRDLRWFCKEDYRLEDLIMGWCSDLQVHVKTVLSTGRTCDLVPFTQVTFALCSFLISFGDKLKNAGRDPVEVHTQLEEVLGTSKSMYASYWTATLSVVIHPLPSGACSCENVPRCSLPAQTP